MAVHHHKSPIVTDGLIFQVDAANKLGGNVSNTRNLVSPTQSGTFTNGASVVDGSFDFDGVDDYIRVLDSTTNFFGFANKVGSISTWVNFNSALVERPIAAKRETGSLGKRHWIFTMLASDSKIYFISYETDFLQDTAISTSTLSTNIWYYLTVTLTPSQTKIYINGALDSTTSNTYTTIQDDQAHLDIGSRGANGDIRYLDGQISNFKIYNKTLTQAEVTQNYEATKHKFE